MLIFDMDGVLVDVTESYRAAIQATVKHFTGNDLSRSDPGLEKSGRLERRLAAFAR